jgi:uncharacterized membrane protein YvlD (DUF360 family)
VPCNDVVGDTKSDLVVGLVQAHVRPSAVLLVPRLVGIPSALLQEGVFDLVVNVLLEHVLVRELHMVINVLQPGHLAKEDDLEVEPSWMLSCLTSSIIASFLSNVV